MSPETVSPFGELHDYRARVLDDLISAAVIAHPLPDTPAAVNPDHRIDLLAAALPNLRGVHGRALLYAAVLNIYRPAWWFERYAIAIAQSLPPAAVRTAASTTRGARLQSICAAGRAVELLERYGGDGEQLTRRANLFAGADWLRQRRAGAVRGGVHTVTVRDTTAAAAAPGEGGIVTCSVQLVWTCPVCETPRAEPYTVTIRERDATAQVQRWDNSCGHVDADDQVLAEAARLARAGLPEAAHQPA